MKDIRSETKTISRLLAGTKYSIDYYQREYNWEKKQVTELIDDLTDKFLEDYQVGHERRDVANYGHYFLGSIIVSNKDGLRFVIDGQQRLTTLTLLLISCLHMLDDGDQKGQVSALIFSHSFGRRSFNLDIPERDRCMDAIYKDELHLLDDNGHTTESIRNIVSRYEDIEEHFPDELQDSVLPYFVDWLIESVFLVEITAYDDSDAYEIFETMNDRGLSLTPTDMLKGYLLSQITDDEKRNSASRVWRERIESLQSLGKEEDADSIKAWLRGQYAKTLRERNRGAAPRDFELIGTEFHRWVRDNQNALGLSSSDSFGDFIERDFSFYSRWYKRLREASRRFTAGLEGVYYNAQHNYTLQYPVLLAPLRVQDSEQDCLAKISLVSTYLDILINRRIWNSRAIDYSTMFYAMYILIRDIRRKSISELAELLYDRLNGESEIFSSNSSFQLRGRNRQKIHRILARITDYISIKSGQPSHYTDYFRTGRNRFEIEHIWANSPDQHEDEFSHPTDFQEYRNRIGGLLLLERSFNASYGSLPFTKKRDHYVQQNLLAQSLHDLTYDRNPGFKQFIRQSGLPFKPYSGFSKSDLDERQKLYQKLAEQIWNPNRLLQADS